MTMSLSRCSDGIMAFSTTNPDTDDSGIRSKVEKKALGLSIGIVSSNIMHLVSLLHL